MGRCRVPSMTRGGLASLLLVPLVATLSTAGLARAEEGEIRVLLKAPREAVLASEIVGRVIDLPVAEGGRFAEGEALARFDCATHEAEHQRAQAELTASRRKLANDRELVRLASIGSLEVALSEASVDKAKAEEKITALVVERCVVQAPYDGRVVEHLVNPFESATLQQPLVKIVETGAPPLELFVPSHWVDRITIGTPFRVQVDETGAVLSAHVTALGASVDPVSQLLRLSAALEDAPADLLPGMSGRALFNGEPRPSE